jgi:hypothetical protein
MPHFVKATKAPPNLPDHRCSGVTIRVKGDPDAAGMEIDIKIT